MLHLGKWFIVYSLVFISLNSAKAYALEKHLTNVHKYIMKRSYTQHLLLKW